MGILGLEREEALDLFYIVGKTLQTPCKDVSLLAQDAHARRKVMLRKLHRKLHKNLTEVHNFTFAQLDNLTER